jgi:hypothetical protein
MAVSEIVARLWRHLLAVIVILVGSVGVLYSLKHTPPQYGESATMVLLPPRSGTKPNPYAAVGGALTDTAGVIATHAMSPQGQQQIFAAGGTASYDVELLNGYNMEFPDFSNPYVTISTTAGSPAQAHQTFIIVSRLLAAQMTARQVALGVPPVDRISTQLAGDSGPLIEQGSPKRSLIGLIVLTMTVLFSVVAFLDRHPLRLRQLPGIRTRVTRRPRGRLGGVRPANGMVLRQAGIRGSNPVRR